MWRGSTMRASPGQTLALGSPCLASRSAASRAYLRDNSMPRKLWVGSACAALSRNSPLPEPISSSTGWSLPKQTGQDTGPGSPNEAGSIRCAETSIAGWDRDIVRQGFPRVASRGSRRGDVRWLPTARGGPGIADGGALASGRAEGLVLPGEGHTDDFAMKDHAVADEALAVEDGVPPM